jgi:SH3 domain protein
MLLRRLSLLIVMLGVVGAAQAEPAYITSDISVAVHAQMFEQGPVIQTLHSGAAVEVLNRDGSYARVRLPSNLVGWIESRYLTSNTPNSLEVTALETRLSAVSAELAEARAQLATRPTGASDKQLANLQSELDKSKAANAKLQDQEQKARAKIKQLESAAATRKEQAGNSLDEAETLRLKVSDLETRLGAALLIENESAARPAGTGLHPGWLIVAMVLSLVAGAAGGMYWLDRRLRRRHGGFRIY